MLVKPETLRAAEALGAKIRDEDGTDGAVAAFYKHLPLLNMRCASSLSAWDHR